MRSKSPAESPATSLKQVVGALATRVADPRRRAEMTSALRTVARVCGQSLDQLPGDVREMRTLLAGVRPAAYRLSPGRWRNVRSLAFSAIEAVRAHPRRSRPPLSPEWEKLLLPLPDKTNRIALVPFARFCSTSVVAPQAVTAAEFGRYERYLDQHARKARPRESYLCAARAWNRARARYRWWPRFQVEIDDRRKTYTLPWAALPPSFKAEVDALVAEALAPDPLSTNARRAIGAVTARGLERSLRALASGIVNRGRPPESLAHIGDLVAIDVAKEGLRYFVERLGRRQDVYLVTLAGALVRAARWSHEIDGTDESVRDKHLNALAALRTAVTPRRRGMTQKNRELLRQVDDDEVIARVLALPDRVWSRADACRHERLTRSHLIRLQVATAVEILTVVPIRRSNLLALQFDRHFVRTEIRGRRRVHLRIPADEVKNGVEIERELPERSVRLIERYLAEVRPLIDTMGCQSAWNIDPASARNVDPVTV
ncbi:MAG: hypothetical protein AB7L90_09100 [Hyphomicrobiaceae bacterium]